MIWHMGTFGRERLTLAEMQHLAQSRGGGSCRSINYVNNKTHLEWVCGKGHEWMARPDKIKRGRWCPACAKKKRRTIEDMHALAAGRKGVCLSERMLGMHRKLLWRCEFGHVFAMTPNNVRERHWCARCAGVARKSLRVVQQVAEQRGGCCLSRSYRNSRTVMRWRCARGHVWPAPAARILRGAWCRTCFDQGQTKKATPIAERRAVFRQ